MRERIYIAGKVTGEPLDVCKMKFEKRKIELFTAGYEPVSPMDLNFSTLINGYSFLSDADRWYCEMRACIAVLLSCDGINLLPDWEYSRGAQIEWQLATKLGKHKIIEL